ncbi:MAG: hypothetical protein NUV54_02145 [Candidatus Taylorbacteria bacterium]|nr:hypothetical protein [Candidatus Taylorbacteria bacterium]
MTEKKPVRTVAFDFDGVIAEYHGFKGVEHTGEPIPEVVDAIRRLKEMGCTILIHSSRGTELLTAYCNKHGIPVDYINNNPMVPNENRGKPVAQVYVDDRGLCFRKQSTLKLIEEIINFEPYWK